MVPRFIQLVGFFHKLDADALKLVSYGAIRTAARQAGTSVSNFPKIFDHFGEVLMDFSPP
jgi:hypothetical protein